MKMEKAIPMHGAFSSFAVYKKTARRKEGQWLKLESSKKYESQTKNGLINH